MLGKGVALRLLIISACLGCWMAPRMAIAGTDGDEAAYEVVDPEGIYLGVGTRPKRPGVMRADDVWREIPEYKQIIDEQLTEEDPKYHLLMLKATERFNRALKHLARRDDHDMLGEIGSISAKGGETIPDVTAEMIRLVSRN